MVIISFSFFPFTVSWDGNDYNPKESTIFDTLPGFRKSCHFRSAEL